MVRGQANYSYAESMAIETLDLCNVTEPPVPVEKIAGKLGYPVFLATFPDDEVAGFLEIGNQKRIVVNASHAPTRRAFTIAHEIGHAQLHAKELADDPDIAVLYRRPIGGETDPIEQEANYFAANLLVPEHLLSKFYNYDVSDSQNAAVFGVSLEVLTHRLRSTGRR